MDLRRRGPSLWQLGRGSEEPNVEASRICAQILFYEVARDLVRVNEKSVRHFCEIGCEHFGKVWCYRETYVVQEP